MFISVLLFGFASAMAQDASTFTGYTIADEGAWCWFADPRALHYENNSGTINATYVGYIDNHGSIKATQVDWKTKTTSEVLIRSWFQPDDHDNPAFLVLPDERIMIIYSRHTDEACFYYRISKRPGDITHLGEEKRLATANNTTYPNPYILSDDPDHIYMCWRGIGWHPTVAQMSMPDANDDIKFTWGPYQMVQSTGARPYAKYMSNGKDKIYLAYTTGHPDNEYPNWLYCNVFDVNDKCLYDINGKKLSTVQNGTFKVEKTDTYKSAYPATVVDATKDRRDWIWNMAFDTKGNPVIGMTKISSDKQNHDYYYAKWNGTAWNASFIANGGKYFHHSSNTENCYSAGMAIDRDDVNTVYCGVPVNGIHEIWKYTLDENSKVVKSEAVTRNSAKSNARPFVIEGTKNAKDGADALRLSWMYGDYYYWIVNSTYKTGYPTSIVAETSLPQNLNSTSGATYSVDMQIDANNYLGDLLTIGNIIFGVNAQQYSYIKIDGKTYTSQNVLGTADSWATENTATTGGKWFSKTKLGRFNLTLTTDGKYLTVYRNGIIDMKIDYTGTLQKGISNASNVTVYNAAYSNECVTQSYIKKCIDAADLETVTLQDKVVTDFVLPSSTPSGKAITWTSNNEYVVSNTGLVRLPKQQTVVTLTATVGALEKTFDVTVYPRNLKNNVRTTLASLDQTSNTAAGFATNKYGKLPEGILKGMRSYTVVLQANAKSLTGAPRLYDFGGGSGNSVFLRANALTAGVKYNGGTTTLVNSPVQLETNKDYKIAVTFDAATKVTKIYLNGEEVVSGTANQNEPYMIYESAGDARNYVGRAQWWDTSESRNNVDFVGTISNLVVYDIALTQKEVCDAQSIPFREKEYASSLTNANFEGKYSVMKGSGVSTDRAIYIPEGWTIDYSARNENDFNALKNGDLYYGQFFSGKPQNPKGGAQTLWIRQRWGASDIKFYQEVKLPQGKYTLTADMLTSDTSGKGYIFINDTKFVSQKANTWESPSLTFFADGNTVYKIGVCASHPDGDGERIYAFDNFSLSYSPVTVKEAVTLINHILQKQYNPTMDMDTNGSLTPTDVQILVDGYVF